MSAPLLVDPNGKALTHSEQDVCDLTEKGAIVLSHFHIIAQKLNWSIRCEHCGEPVQGYNNGHERYLSCRCGCREYRAEVSAASRQRFGS